jgi:hypothetical protein
VLVVDDIGVLVEHRLRVFDGEFVLAFEINEQDTERPAPGAGLVRDEVQHDRGILAR